MDCMAVRIDSTGNVYHLDPVIDMVHLNFYIVESCRGTLRKQKRQNIEQPFVLLILSFFEK